MRDPLLRLERATSALVIVDPQTRLMPLVVERQRIVRAMQLLLRAAAVLELPVIATTQYEKGLGPIVPEIEELLPEAVIRHEKVTFSCFDDARFGQLLAESTPAVTTLLVAGIEGHICVAGTVLGALRAGYAVEVAVDGVSARDERDLRVGLERMTWAGALPTTAEMAVYELLGRSDVPEFKAMLPHLKV